MKQRIILTLMAFVLAPLSVFAQGQASFTIETTDVSVRVGETFDLSVGVNPNGEQIDTARLILTFDPTALRVQSVQLSGAFDRSAPGNYIDNRAGKVSWGAFTLDGPVSAQGSFATLTILALQDVETSVSISSDSKLISNGEEKINTSSKPVVGVSVAPEAVIEEGTSLIVVNSNTHLNDLDWYSKSTVEMSWVALQGDSPITSYYFDFDQQSSTDPDRYLDGGETDFSETVEDGVYYFHIKGVQENGEFTPTVHRRVNVDTTKPNEIELVASDDQLIEGEALWLTFATTDEMSGVLQYQIAINNSEFQLQESPLEMTDLQPGTYFFRVAALDRAGNATYRGTSVRIYPEDTELDRPEGYEVNSEVEGIIEGLQSQSEEAEQDGKKKTLLITLVLVGVLGFGIIYLTKRKK